MKKQRLKLFSVWKTPISIFCFILWASASTFAQTTVNGTIKDTTGETLPGVNIIESGTKNGVISDFDGKFQIKLKNNPTELTISLLGYKTVKKTITKSINLNITLEEEASLLNEIVVVGYGSQRKSDVTGALSSVSSKDFEKQPITKIDQALQGRAAGVQVNQTSGAPGSGFKIRIRGSNSISGNNDPLYVVDGLVVGNINSLNVNDIKSMEVLKDASSTAIYGSRGANGVVLITTKTGRSGPAKVDLEIFTSISNVVQKIDMMTPAQFAEGVNFAENATFFSEDQINALRQGGGEDWQNRLFTQAMAINAQLSVSGGSDDIDYFISGNFFESEGTIINQNYKRYTLRSNLNANLTDKIKVGLNTFASREELSGERANIAFGLTWDPTTPAFNDAGEYNFIPLIPGVGNGLLNPLIEPENNIRNNFNNRFTVSSYVNYNILENLDLNISGGIDRFDRNNNRYIPRIVNNIGVAQVEDIFVTRIQNTNRLTYTWNKNPDHSFKIDAIHEQQQVLRENKIIDAQNFFTDQTGYKDVSLAAIQAVQNSNTNENLQSFLGRINYSFLDKYLFTVSVRGDGSSKFREDNRWGVFPSGSFAWNVSKEKFLENSETINNLKMRLSYGIIGSQAIDPLATRSLPILGDNVNYPFTGGALFVGLAPSNRLANPNLTWETTRQSNIGFDLGLWNSALTVSLDLYRKNTEDLLLERILPDFVGPTVQTINAGEVQNQGFDLTIGARILDNDKWKINSTFTLSSNRNEVISLIDGIDALELGNSFAGNFTPVNPTRVEVGKPISSFRGYIFEGVYQLGEEAEAAAFGRVPGDAKYRDINNDGSITTDDITSIGNGNPNFTWGWNWDVSYKNFDLNFILLGSQGNDIYNFQRGRMMALGAQQFHATHADYNNRWTPTNPSNIPAQRDGTELLSTQFLEDGSFVSLKNVSLGYNVNKDVLDKIGLNQLKLYVNAENLFIITNYTGFDPESTATGQSDVDLGIDINTYPINRTFSFGMKVGF
ncbi:TonB-dependent receptor [Polaribacter sp. Hel_I_88]|uniref:SusC/RagA family TonB-linked outer membrane protein n=1 Tax=Polaribacter sp. Hel_I_88 TaxID=1250006 RepID=UPI00047AEEDE|nr:TonB-dependent receptor [Polaribacter sp. Hel_I_88]